MCVWNLLAPILCHFSRGEDFFSRLGASSGPFLHLTGGEMDLHSAGVKSKHLFKLKKNSKQGFGCTWNETKAGARLSQ